MFLFLTYRQRAVYIGQMKFSLNDPYVLNICCPGSSAITSCPSHSVIPINTASRAICAGSGLKCWRGRTGTSWSLCNKSTDSKYNFVLGSGKGKQPHYFVNMCWQAEKWYRF